MGLSKLLILFVVLVIGVILISRNKNSKKAMGSLFSIGGGIAFLYGIIKMNSKQVQLRELLGNNRDKDFATFVLIIGIILIVAGFILLYNSGIFSKGRETLVNNPDNYNKHDIRVRCISCNELNNEDSSFCSKCGKSLLTESSKII